MYSSTTTADTQSKYWAKYRTSLANVAAPAPGGLAKRTLTPKQSQGHTSLWAHILLKDPTS